MGKCIVYRAGLMVFYVEKSAFNFITCILFL